MGLFPALLIVAWRTAPVTSPALLVDRCGSIASPRPRRMAAIVSKPTVAQRRDVPTNEIDNADDHIGGSP
jgi:hypothetical protein